MSTRGNHGRQIVCVRRGSAIVLILGFSIAANVILTTLAGILIDRFHELTGNAYLEEQQSSAQTWKRRPLAINGKYAPVALSQPLLLQLQPTLPPRNTSVDSAGFIHIGKTGGSTISKMIRNGCNSFAEGPCRNITNETVISKFVVS